MRADALGHAVLRDHRAGERGGLLDVVGGAGRRVVEDDLLGRAAAEHVGELVEHLVAGRGVLVLVGQHHRVAERPAARQDRDLVHRVGVRQRRRDQSVPALVVGGDLLLLVAHDPGALLRAGHDAVDGLVERVGVDELLVVAGGQQRGLVEHVRQVGAGEAGRTAGERLQVDVLGDRLALGVHLEDLLAADQVGTVDGDLPVEAAGAQQRRVEDVGPVGRGDQDDAALDVEAVHLDEQLVQRLLALVVAAAEAGAAVAADGVDLVDEDDGGRVGLGLLEQVADAAGADADEHLDEVRAGDRVERHARLAGDGTGEQRLAGAGRAVQQHALGDLGADGLELGRVLEELLDLLQLLDRLVGPGDVRNVVFGVSLLISLALDLPNCMTREPPPCIWLKKNRNSSDQDEDRQEAESRLTTQLVLRDAVGVALGRRVLLEQVDRAARWRAST